jgi:hypothetical protein
MHGRIGSALFVLGCALLLSAPLLGCTTHYIPNTDVEDTDDNRKLIAFCEKYRHAVELKNIALLLKLASPKYYEDGGNVDASDDLDYAGLRDYLTNRFQDARSIRYEIRYRRVVKEDDRIFVDYTYSASYRIPGSEGEEWRRRVDDNRLELLPTTNEDEFLILAGM